MSENVLHQAATGGDAPRQVATSPDQYTLTIDDALVRYEHAGFPRTPRSVQRYCAKGHLDCLRQETTYGDKFMITPASVARHISQIAELASASGRDMARQVATPEPTTLGESTSGDRAATSSDLSRQDATGRPVSQGVVAANGATAEYQDRYIARLESENEFLRGQMKQKDTQIGELTERARETNFLIKGLQDLVLRLQPGSPAPAGDWPADQTSKEAA